MISFQLVAQEGSRRNVPALMPYGNSCLADNTIFLVGSVPIRSLLNTADMKRGLTVVIKHLDAHTHYVNHEGWVRSTH